MDAGGDRPALAAHGRRRPVARRKASFEASPQSPKDAGPLPPLWLRPARHTRPLPRMRSNTKNSRHNFKLTYYRCNRSEVACALLRGGRFFRPSGTGWGWWDVFPGLAPRGFSLAPLRGEESGFPRARAGLRRGALGWRYSAAKSADEVKGYS